MNRKLTAQHIIAFVAVWLLPSAILINLFALVPLLAAFLFPFVFPIVFIWTILAPIAIIVMIREVGFA